MRRIGTLLVCFVAVTAALVGAPAAAPAEAATLRVTVSPARPIRGELFVVSGTLGTPIDRDVVLQRKSGKRWVGLATGRSLASGAFSLSANMRAASLKVRVFAPAFTSGTTHYSAVTSRTRSVSTIGQTSRVSMAGSAFVNQAVPANLAFKPGRAGRPTEVQVLRNGSWQSVATGFETASGKSTIPLIAATAGTFTYRGVALAWHGAPARVTKRVKVKIKADVVKVDADARPLTAAENDAIQDYNSASGTVVFTAAPKSISTVTTGDVITIEPRTGAESGALRRVSSVSRSGSTTTVRTIDANLPEVIQNVPDAAAAVGLTVLSSQFTPSAGVTVKSLPRRASRVGISGLRPSSVGELALRVSKKWEDAGAAAELSGDISVAPVIDLSLDVDWFRLKAYRVGAGVQVANSLKASVSYSASAGKRYSIGVLKQLLMGNIGPVPVWVDANFEIYASWTIEGSLEITAEVSQTGRITAGITNTSANDLSPTLYGTTAASFTALSDLKASGKIGIFAGAEASLMLYSLAGPYAALGAELEATIDGSLATGFDCRLTYGPHAEAGLRVSDGIEKLTGKPFRMTAQLIKPTTSNSLCPSGDGGGDPPSGAELAISTSALTAATIEQPYAAVLEATGGTAPYIWTAEYLPPGLSISADGDVTGTPSQLGDFLPTFTVTDTAGKIVTRTLSLSVHEGASLTAAVAVGRGYGHSCALLRSGQVKCWGDNENGPLGDGDTNSSAIPMTVTGLMDAVAVAGGHNHTCAVRVGGTVQCWGHNWFGQLGIGVHESPNITTPVTVNGLSGIRPTIAVGASHTCVITAEGGVKCWGYNSRGQLGDGSTTDRDLPVDVVGLTSGVKALSANASDTCALMEAGDVRCWGDNTYGQLGNGTTEDSSVPVTVPGLSAASGVAVGGYHACAVVSGGAVRCWGHNHLGQLGDGTTTDSPVPVAVNGLSSGVAQVGAMGFGTCVRTASGAAECWGINSSGSLGDGTTTNRAEPVGVVGLDAGVADLGVSGGGACVVMDTGGMKCWGYGNNGMLGNGTWVDSSVPVDVVGIG